MALPHSTSAVRAAPVNNACRRSHVRRRRLLSGNKDSIDSCSSKDDVMLNREVDSAEFYLLLSSEAPRRTRMVLSAEGDVVPSLLLLPRLWHGQQHIILNILK